jgi:uncharacterized protein (DUF1778 family)
VATTHETRSRRINLRASKTQETLIRAGARVRGVNVTDFILESACSRAEQAIADQTTFKLSSQQWKKFTEALDRPPMLHPKPRLKRLLSEPSVAESR